MRSLPSMKKGTVLASTLVVLMLLCPPWPSARAYEIDTHATITEHAFQAALTQGNLGRSLTHLGLSTTTFLQDPTSTIIQDPTCTFDLHNRPPNASTPLEWTCNGSRHEDDGLRPLNHFFDDIHVDVLSGLCNGVVGISSPDWGLEASGIFLNQEFSFNDARHYFFNGLTLPTKQERDSNLAKMFRALGQVMHLIQDMANPQHVRDDAHNPDVNIQTIANLVGCATSSPLYERIIDQHRLSSSLNYDGYPLPDFQSPRDFWKTGDGRGLAEFTSSQFVSEGTNFNQFINGATDGKHSYPKLYLPWKEEIYIQLPNTYRSGYMTFYLNIVGDLQSPEYNGVAAKFWLITTSIFDNDLILLGKNPIFALNRYNVYAYAELLLPRAVGYSAGLLNYFFRGSIDAYLEASGNLIVKNLSSEDMSGRFTLYYDDANDVRRSVVSIPSLTIGHNMTGSLGSFTPPTSPPPKEPGKYILVFDGSMGQEDNAVVGSTRVNRKLTVQISGSPGSVALDPPGIKCSPPAYSTCEAYFRKDEVVTLTAGGQGSFDGWSGDCNGQWFTTKVIMDDDRTCVAHFIPEPGTIALMGLGIAGLGIMGRWRQIRS